MVEGRCGRCVEKVGDVGDVGYGSRGWWLSGGRLDITAVSCLVEAVGSAYEVGEAVEEFSVGKKVGPVCRSLGLLGGDEKCPSESYELLASGK